MAFKGQGQEQEQKEKNSLEDPFKYFFNVLCKRPGNVIYSGNLMHGKSSLPTIDKLFLKYVVGSQKKMIKMDRCKVVSNWCKGFQEALQNHVKKYMNEINKLKESLDLSNTESIRNFKGEIIKLYREAHGELAKILRTMIEKAKDAAYVTFDGKKQKTDLCDLQSFLEEQLKKFNELKSKMTEENLSKILHLDELEAEGEERNIKAFKKSVEEFQKYFHLEGFITKHIEPLSFIKITIIHMRPKEKKYLSTPQKAFYDAFAHFSDTNINKWCDEFDKRLLDHHNKFYTKFKKLSEKAKPIKELRDASRALVTKLSSATTSVRSLKCVSNPKTSRVEQFTMPNTNLGHAIKPDIKGEQDLIRKAARLFDDAKNNLINIFDIMKGKLKPEFQISFDAFIKDFNSNQLERLKYLDSCMSYFGLSAIASDNGGPKAYKILGLL